VKALVSGGAGFIGGHLVERLLADGLEVVVVDNLATGRAENLAAVAGNPRVQFHRVDIADAEALAPCFAGVDRAFHLAGLADIVPSIEAPAGYYRTNVTGTLNMLEAARAAGVRRFVYAASSSCYGIPDVYPTPETAPIRPMYPYALTKRLGEELVLHWAQVYGLPAISLRLFNVYGPRSRTSGAYGAVMGVFLAQKLAGKPFTVVGDGRQSRDFTEVADVVDAFVTAAASDVSGQCFNVGSGTHVSINRLVELIGGDQVHIPKRPGEPDITFADIRRIGEVLGWRPQVSIETGMQRIMSHIDDWRTAPVWTPDTIAEATASWFRCLGDKETTT